MRFYCGDAFCTDTLLQTDDVTHRNLYTEQLLCADTLAQRCLCTDKLLHADTFTHRGFYAKKFYTQKFLYTDALHKDAFTRINKGTQALLHTEPFTQRNLCTEQFLHKGTSRQENFDTKNLLTQTAQRSFYTPKLLHPETLLHTDVFPHRSLHAQQFLHRPFYPQMPLHRFFYTEASAHSTLLHAARFYTERFCFPFLITYLSCSPSHVALHQAWQCLKIRTEKFEASTGASSMGPLKCWKYHVQGRQVQYCFPRDT